MSWQMIKGFDKSDFRGVLSINHRFSDIWLFHKYSQLLKCSPILQYKGIYG